MEWDIPSADKRLVCFLTAEQGLTAYDLFEVEFFRNWGIVDIKHVLGRILDRGWIEGKLICDRYYEYRLRPEGEIMKKMFSPEFSIPP